MKLLYISIVAMLIQNLFWINYLKEYDILSNDKLMKENNFPDSLVEHLKKEKTKKGSIMK